MAESEWYTGIVLEAVPIGEYDRRVVLLTREAGKRMENSGFTAAEAQMY